MSDTPFKMKGHALPGPNQKASPAKHPHDEQMAHGINAHNTDTGKSVAQGGKAKPGNPNYVTPKKKSPAKCPLIAAAAPAIIGAMTKKKEEKE